MIKKRCDHIKIMIQETGSVTTTHFRDEDGNWSHDSSVSGTYKNVYHVTCLNCGLKSFYSRYSKNLPK